MRKLITLTVLLISLPAIADSNAELLKKVPQQADWYQQLESTQPLTSPNVFTMTDPVLRDNDSTLTVHTKPFTTINLQGHYQVEIIGNAQTSRVEITGDQQDVLNTQLLTNPETHSISLSEKQAILKKVTVKILAPVIQTLINNGNGNVNAKNLNGDAVTLINNGNGNVFVTGDANFKKITLNGNGNIQIDRGLADAGTVIDNGNGNIIMQGNYALKTLTNQGNGKIRIDGMNSRGLNVKSGGNGDIVLSGFANLETLTHTGNGDVFFYWVNSSNMHIQASGKGVIGLAGAAKQLDVNLDGQVVFDGRYLKAEQLNIKTLGNARAKVIAGQQLTAAAGGESQIFYYNKPAAVLKYSSGNGAVLSMP